MGWGERETCCPLTQPKAVLELQPEGCCISARPHFCPQAAPLPACPQIVSRPGNASTGNDQMEYTEQLERDLRPATGLTTLSCQLPSMSFARLRAEAVWAQPEWQGLSAEQKVRGRGCCCCRCCRYSCRV